MSRLAEVFARARRDNRKVLVIYLTASDPTTEMSFRLLDAAILAGADIVEIGIPWSDPSADGLAIQAAMHRALLAGGGRSTTLALCARLRAAHPQVGIVLFGYANPVVVRGVDAFARDAQRAGADGVLIVDWPPDEDPALADALRTADIDLVPLLAPTSTPARILRAAELAGGFLYYVSLTGITGAQLSGPGDVAARVAEINKLTGKRLPVVVGFGVKTAADARAVADGADGVVVGSAAVDCARKATEEGRDPVAALSSFVADLRAALG